MLLNLLSVNKMGKVYWDNDRTKTEYFFQKTKELIKSVPLDIVTVCTESDIELKAPAVLIVAQK